MHNHIKHIFFDLDHTLWDFEKNSALTFQKIFKKNNVSVNLDAFLEVYSPINFYYWKLYRNEHITKPALRYRRLKDAFDALDFEISDDLIHRLSIDYIEFLTTFSHVFDGAYDTLNYLKERYTLHIITNGFEEAQERKMVASNLRLYFTTVTNSEMVGVKKPNPKIFNFALQQAHAHAKTSVMIGDNLEADVQGALAVGMDAILFQSSNIIQASYYKQISHLMELKTLF